MIVSRAQLIREWLAQQDGPRTAAQIAIGIGQKDAALHVHWAIGVMYRDGVLERVGVHRGYRYMLGRPVKPPMSREEARKRRTERERARFRKKGVRPLAEWNAIRAQRAAERAEAKRIERERRFAETQQQRRDAKAKAERAAADKKARTYTPKPKPRTLQIVAKLERIPSAPVVAPPKPRLETVEEYLARGGKIDRLPTSWESREQKAA